MPETNKSYKVKVNDFVFFFDEKQIKEVDIVQRSATEFNCIKENKSFNALLKNTTSFNKKLEISIDGEIFFVEIKDELDQMLEVMGFGLAANKKQTNIKAPMPGLVLDINVIEGQVVNEGDKILILEAMKMENSIMIPGSATIKKILVSKGQAVDRGQVLVELE
ncbi:MAG: acetyl-CoA carboxylase biotin carboxyl carrier protein subunit [Ferruginibacter sp.]